MSVQEHMEAKAWDPLELEFQVVWRHLTWLLQTESGLIEGQEALLTTEMPLQTNPFSSTSSFLLHRIVPMSSQV